jgi:hypothetical protein
MWSGAVYASFVYQPQAGSAGLKLQIRMQQFRWMNSSHVRIKNIDISTPQGLRALC